MRKREQRNLSIIYPYYWINFKIVGGMWNKDTVGRKGKDG
jgi:hypothetical protein